MDSLLCFINNNIDFLTLLVAIFGGALALVQWRQQIKQNRVEKVKELISKVRDDEDIALVMNIIDWDNGLVYDGKFHSSHESMKQNNSGKTLAYKVDKTLSHYSYICYLRRTGVFARKDMKVFSYNLRRLVDNKNIGNYLFSLYHWSRYLGVNCSFIYLIEYALKRGYLQKSFRRLDSHKYKCCLSFPGSEVNKTE